MKRIDFIGPVGVGKTTLYKDLLRRRKGGDAWLTPGEARAKIARTLYWNKARTAGDYIKYLALHLNSLKPFYEYLARNINSKKQLLAYEQEYDELSKLACAYAESDDAPLLKIRNIALIEQDMESLSVLEEGTESVSNHVIFNESLTQKIFQWLMSDLADEDIALLLPLLPLPDAFVYCHATPEVINERLIKREKTTFHHQLLNSDKGITTIERDTRHLERTSLLLPKAGVYGIKIDMTRPRRECVETVESFIRTL